MGFGVPIDHWFRNELKEMAYDTLLSDRAVQRGYFKKEAAKKFLMNIPLTDGTGRIISGTFSYSNYGK